jgi:2-dehydropantoate 2-reductase
LEIDKFIWAKMLYNCSLNPLSAILRVPYGTLLETDSSKDTIVHIVEEIFSVARAKKVKLFWDNASEYIDVLFNRLVPDTAAHQSSMLQDIRAGRRTEIDAMNGAVASLGEEAGVACPVNWTITKIIQSLQTQQFK